MGTSATNPSPFGPAQTGDLRPALVRKIRLVTAAGRRGRPRHRGYDAWAIWRISLPPCEADEDTRDRVRLIPLLRSPGPARSRGSVSSGSLCSGHRPSQSAIGGGACRPPGPPCPGPPQVRPRCCCRCWCPGGARPSIAVATPPPSSQCLSQRQIWHLNRSRPRPPWRHAPNHGGRRHDLARLPPVWWPGGEGAGSVEPAPAATHRPGTAAPDLPTGPASSPGGIRNPTAAVADAHLAIAIAASHGQEEEVRAVGARDMRQPEVALPSGFPGHHPLSAAKTARGW